ncbi:SusC/RagA family TonB-linked outer membrane protein [Chitinophaga agrisoli]|uniref:SusC/RagA family TonB-linked outer membrane protein n=1 Tax=Chitinophaga agrisoli TaxID=2607653 RepID=A0A5B2W2U4_9BACT|nr:SusC/RagA family TonB-linked outer membrane protein [Chitinophaga agrisoli]KAA2245414.1 SusC/RagA family TonB-linked outer membrane protein [Chitinophaga agrisoli]
MTRTDQNLILGLLWCALTFGMGSPVTAQIGKVYASRQTTTFHATSQSGGNNKATISLKEALDRLRKFHNIRIAYREGLLDGKTIAADLLDKAERMEPEAALKQVLTDQRLEYKRINEKQFSIFNPSAHTTDSLASLLSVYMMADKLKGRVISSKDSGAIPGATIYLKSDPSTATMADGDGRFELTLKDKDKTGPLVLVISSIGFEKQEVTVSDPNGTIIVKLEDANKSLSEVVVTALGIRKEKKAVAFAVTEVSGSEFTKAREINIANALSGKIAGVNATSLASGPGSSSRVIIRGNGSLNGDNQPLYVVNGMPIDNTSPGGTPTTSDGGLNVDRGDGIAGINPDDIETMSVLKGGPAAALYGSRAANGVILITTKKGRARKGIGVDYNTTLTLENPSVTPDWQYEYGQGDGGVKPTTQQQAIDWGRRSFGTPMDGSLYTAFDGKQHPYSPQKDNIKNFYNTGTTFINTLAFNGGSEVVNYRFSLSNTDSKSILPNSSLNKKIANLNVNAYLGKKISIEAVAQYNVENAKNRPSAGDATGNPNWAVYMIANTVDIRSMAPGYDSAGREIQWNETPYASNSYFVINRFQNNDTKNRFIGQASIRYDVLKNLFVKGSVSRDFFNYDFTGIIPTGTVYTLGGTGTYSGKRVSVAETNAMLTMNYNTKFWDKVGLNVLAGGNKRKYTSDETDIDGTQFVIPFFYSYTNLATVTTKPIRNRTATNSLFGSIDLDYKSLIFLTLTGRQDWFSTLSPLSNSIFYPAIGTSFILSDAVQLPAWVNFAKIRASWAQVGGATPDPYILNQTFSSVQGGHLGQPVQQVTTSQNVNLVTNATLKPLTSTTYEAGLEAQFLHNRLGIDLTFYDRKTTNDIVRTAISRASGYNDALLNVGEVDNKGVELLLTGTPVKSKSFSWDVSYNVAYNKNEVVKLAEGLNTIQMAQSVGGWAFVHNTVGRPYGIIKGYKMERNEKGDIIYASNGYPVKSDLVELGQGVPPLTMGITNTFNYKRLSFEFLVDGKFGNKVFSTMDVYATRFGLHKSTLPGRENGLVLSGVNEAGNADTHTIPVANLRLYYDNLKNYTELFVQDGSFVKLRQVILSYQLPLDHVWKLKMQSASVSLVARNLLILYKNTDNFDPESSYTSGNAQGFEAFAVPRTRSYGFNLMVKF